MFLMVQDDDEFVNKTVDTVIDRLYDFVRINKSTTVHDIARALTLSEAQVEKLTHLLEDAHLVSLTYGISDIIVAMPSQEAEEKSGPATGQSPEQKFDGDARRLETEVSKSRGVLDFALGDLYERTKKIEALLAALEGDANASPSKIASLKSEVSQLTRETPRLKSQIVSLERAVDGLEARLEQFELAIASIESRPAQVKPQQGGGLGGMFGLGRKPPARPDAKAGVRKDDDAK
jgi:chromosome segregation ATPase